MIDPDRQRLASVKVGDWSLTIDAVHVGPGELLYEAHLTGPEHTYSLTLWPSLEATWESVAGYLRRLNLEHVAVALRASAEAEMR